MSTKYTQKFFEKLLRPHNYEILSVKREIGLGTAIKTGFGMNVGNKLGDWLFGSSSKEEIKVFEILIQNNCSQHTQKCWKSA